MIASGLSHCVWKFDAWLYCETVFSVICAWCWLSNLNFLYHHKIYNPSSKRQRNRINSVLERLTLWMRCSHMIRTLQLSVILFTVIWQYAKLQVSWEKCTVTRDCSTIRVFTITFAIAIFLYYRFGICLSYMHSFHSDQGSWSRWLQEFGSLSQLSLLILTIVLQFYMSSRKDENEICHMSFRLNQKMTSYMLSITAIFIVATELLSLGLFIYPLYNLRSNEMLLKHENINKRSIVMLMIRVIPSSMVTTLGTLIFMLCWANNMSSWLQQIRTFALFAMLGLAQYLTMSFSYLHWNNILCPGLLSVIHSRLYTCFRGKRKISRGELHESLISKDQPEQNAVPSDWDTTLTRERSAESSISSLYSNASMGGYSKPGIHIGVPKRETSRERNKHLQIISEVNEESLPAYPRTEDLKRGSTDPNLKIPGRSNVRKNISLSEQKPSNTRAFAILSNPSDTFSETRFQNFSRNLEISLGFPLHKKRRGQSRVRQEAMVPK